MSVCMTMFGKVRSDWSLLVLSLSRRSACCPQPSLPTSEELMVWAFECPSPRLVASISYQAQSTQPVTPGCEYTWPLVTWTSSEFSSSSTQWCSVNTTPSRGLAHQLRRSTWVWHLEPTCERFRRWMRTRVAHPPYLVECSWQTTKALSLSSAPYIPIYKYRGFRVFQNIFNKITDSNSSRKSKCSINPY